MTITETGWIEDAANALRIQMARCRVLSGALTIQGARDELAIIHRGLQRIEANLRSMTDRTTLGAPPGKSKN